MLPIMTHAIYSDEIILTELEPLICTISMIVKETIHLMQSSYFFFVGVKKANDALSKPSAPNLSLQSRTESIFSQVIGFVKTIPSRLFSYEGMHSTLFLGTGTCELLLGLQVIDWISLGSMTPIVANVSSGCFILANLVMLIQSVKQFHNAENEGKDPGRVRKSSLIAILSALNYIAGMATIVVGGPAALIVVLLSLGLTFGGLKILYDFFYPVCPLD